MFEILLPTLPKARISWNTAGWWRHEGDEFPDILRVTEIGEQIDSFEGILEFCLVLMHPSECEIRPDKVITIDQLIHQIGETIQLIREQQ